MEESKPEFKDYLVIRLWGRASEGAEVCVLRTGQYSLSRHYRLHLRKGIHREDVKGRKKVPGLRRYKTEKMATIKAVKLNRLFKTNGHRAIREDKI